MAAVNDEARDETSAGGAVEPAAMRLFAAARRAHATDEARIVETGMQSAADVATVANAVGKPPAGLTLGDVRGVLFGRAPQRSFALPADVTVRRAADKSMIDEYRDYKRALDRFLGPR